MTRTIVIAVTAAVFAGLAAIPASAVPPAPIKVAGTQATVDYAHGKFAMRGSLVGAWQVTSDTEVVCDETRCNPIRRPPRPPHGE